MNADPNFEAHLDALREGAKHGGAVTGHGVDVAGGPIPRRPGYYGEAVVKPPVWTWEIPLYFFVGGAAGMAPLIACAGFLLGLTNIVRSALWIAGLGAILSPILLIMDLGRPQLSSTCCGCSSTARRCRLGPGLSFSSEHSRSRPWLLFELYCQEAFAPSVGPLVVVSRRRNALLSPAIFGLGLATYTGVLIGATAIPAWFLHRVLLPIHFGTAGLGCAVSLLELLGHQVRPLFFSGCWLRALKPCFGSGSKSTNTAPPIARSTPVRALGSSASVKFFPGPSRSFFA